MEKVWAQRAGLGWQGKHTNLITRDYGSWLFLGEILLDIELEYDDEFIDDLYGGNEPWGLEFRKYLYDINTIMQY